MSYSCGQKEKFGSSRCRGDPESGRAGGAVARAVCGHAAHLRHDLCPVWPHPHTITHGVRVRTAAELPEPSGLCRGLLLDATLKGGIARTSTTAAI